MEGSAVGDADELRRRASLFGCVLHPLQITLHVDPISVLSRGSRKNYSAYQNAPLPAGKMKET